MPSQQAGPDANTLDYYLLPICRPCPWLFNFFLLQPLHRSTSRLHRNP